MLLVVALSLSSCSWRGISNVSIPGGPGSGKGTYTIYVQVPDTLAINGNSKVMVADVTVGSIRAINLKNWVAILQRPVDGDDIDRLPRRQWPCRTPIAPSLA
ncbi:MlaD family protein [Actinomadura welshii]